MYLEHERSIILFETAGSHLKTNPSRASAKSALIILPSLLTAEGNRDSGGLVVRLFYDREVTGSLLSSINSIFSLIWNSKSFSVVSLVTFRKQI